MSDNKKTIIKPTYRISLYYFVFSVIWILVSDYIVSMMTDDPAYITKLEIIKGWFFVTVSAVFIFILINKYLRLYAKSEEQKEAIREHYNNFIRKANDIIILTDSEWKIVEVNEKTVETYGYSREELIGMTMWQLRTEQGNQRFSFHLESFEGVKGSIVETEHRKKTGEIFPVDSTFHFIILGDEKYIQLILRDISAIKESEDRLVRANRLYSVLTSINKSIVRYKTRQELLDSVCRIIVEKGEFASAWIGLMEAYGEPVRSFSSFNLNDEYYSLVGSAVKDDEHSIGGSINCPIINFSVKGIKSFNNRLDSVVLQCPFREKVLRMGRLSCSAFPIYVSGRLYGGLMIYSSEKDAFTDDIVGLLDDLVADLSFALENIETKKIKEKLEIAVEKSPVSIIITDLSGIIEYVNPMFISATGFSFSDAVNKSVFEFLDSNNPAVKNIILDSVAEKGSWHGEILTRSKDGNELWELVSVSAGRMLDSDTSSLVFVKENISLIKQTEAGLRDAKEKAEEINRLKSVFLANMNHELRTPLTGILGYANIMSEELKEPHYREMAEIIIKCGKRLTDTLNSILDLTGLESKAISLNKSLVSIPDVLDSAVKNFSSIADEKNLEFRFVNESGALQCWTDERILTQILDNLLENAFKYTDKGYVAVNLSSVDIEDESYALIKVSDTGIGIPQQYIKLIFEPFRQVSEGLSRKFEGTGLGLTITKRFIELLGGRIEVDSVIGKGSEFRVLIPLKKDYIAETKREKKEKVSKVKSRKMRDILVVEDDIVSFRLIDTLLKRKFNFVHVPDGESAVREIQKKTYDLILMDINLRGINGVDTLSMIKFIDRYKNVPVIAVTAYAMSGDSDYLMDRGFDAYIAKPFTKQSLLEVINAVLG